MVRDIDVTEVRIVLYTYHIAKKASAFTASQQGLQGNGQGRRCYRGLYYTIILMRSTHDLRRQSSNTSRGLHGHEKTKIKSLLLLY